MAMEWIDEALTEGVLPDEYPDPAEVAPATDIEEVNRLLRRLRAVRRRMDEATTIASSEKQAIQEWLAEQLAPLEQAEAYIERALEGWMRDEFDRTATKTHKLPFGELRLRPKRSAVEVVNEGQAIGWLIEHVAATDDVVKTERSIIKTGISDRAEPGEVASEDEVYGWRYREAMLPVADPETGEITDWPIPGVLLRERADGNAGYIFSVEVTKTQQED